MYRIDNPSAVASLPTPIQPGNPGYFTDGIPTQGQEATIVDADWANALQEEMSFVIESAGLVLSKTDRTQLAQALAILTRRRLTAPLTMYVSPTGSDNNNGLTPGTAFATIAHAYEFIRDRIDLNGFQSTIQLENGTYAGTSLGYQCNGPSPIINGNAADASLVTINGVGQPAIQASANAHIQVQNLTLTASQGASFGSGLRADTASVISFNNIRFGVCQSHFDAAPGGVLITSLVSGTTYSIVGGAQVHFASSGGFMDCCNAQVTLVGIPNFSIAFCESVQLGLCNVWGNTYTGAATGARYAAASNAVIQTNNAGANYFPGNAAGTVGTGGLYL